MSGIRAQLVEQMLAVLEPLVASGHDPARRQRLLTALNATDPRLDLGGPLEALGDIGEGVAVLRALAGADNPTLAESGEAIDALRRLFDGIRRLGETQGSDYPELGADLISIAVIDRLRHASPLAFQLALMFGLIEPGVTRTIKRGDDFIRPGAPIPRIMPERFNELFADPVALLMRGLPEEPLATTESADRTADALVERCGGVLTALNLPWSYGAVPEDEVEAGDLAADMAHALALFVPDSLAPGADASIIVSLSAADEDDLGIVVTLFGAPAVSLQYGTWAIDVTVSADAGSIAFGGGEGFRTIAPASGGGVRLGVVAKRLHAEGEPAAFFGEVDGTRLEFGAPVLSAILDLGPERTDLRLEAETGPSAFVLKPDQADSFLQRLLPAEGMRADFDFGLRWSRSGGLVFKGGGGLDLRIPIGLSVGGVTLSDAHLRLLCQDSRILGEASLSLAARLGGLYAAVDGIGLTADLIVSQAGGSLGVADFDLRFKPPDGIALAVDTSAVSGGGYLFHDPATGNYFGILSLRLGKKITLKAFGLVATRNPDGTPGSSIIVIATVEQLGWQVGPVTVDGLGLLVARDRTFDENAVRAALPTGQLKNLLFPTDPLRHAAEILQPLQTFFPAEEGRTLIGLLGKLFLGKRLMRLDLAFILEWYPGDLTPDRLIVLGRLSSVLPTDDVRAVQLNLDAVGVFDFSGGTVALDAVLVDSKLVGRFPLTGAAAFRRVPGVSGFALSVGGFHPRFTPPPGFPVLPRVTVALTTGDNPKLIIQGYLAVTANTLQFGADASLYAAACGFSITGNVGFDVLIQFWPPHFLAEFRASVQLKRGSTNLFKVAVEGLLEGPFPLRVAGKATFEILWWDVTVSFDKTLIKGDDIQPEIAPVDAQSEVIAALNDPRNWSAELPDAAALMVALRRDDRPDQILVHPMGTLQAQQGVAPLNLTRDIDRLGEARATGARRFAITSVDFGGDSPTERPVRNEFARGQLFDMTDDERLAAPSFEQMEAGVAFGDDSYAFAPSAVVRSPFDYEDFVFDAEGKPVEEPELPPVEAPIVITLAGLGAAARASFRDATTRFASAPSPDAPVLRPVGYAVASVSGTSTPATPAPTTTWTTWTEAHHALTNDGFEPGAVLVVAALEATPRD